MALMILGAGGHGKVVADIARCCGETQIAFLSDGDSRLECMGYPIVGDIELANQYPQHRFVVAIGNAQIRRKLQLELLKQGLELATLVHPKAVVSETASLGMGTVVMAGAIINPGASIGAGCIINTCSSVDHDCVLEDYTHVSVGAHLAGGVIVGAETWIGAGATVIDHISICSGCMIGAGAVVVSDIYQPGTYVGVPARKR